MVPSDVTSRTLHDVYVQSVDVSSVHVIEEFELAIVINNVLLSLLKQIVC